MYEDLRVKDLGFEVPEFIHTNITVNEVFDLCEMNPTRYFERIHDLFCLMVYTKHSEEIWQYLSRDPKELLDPDFEQMSFNFVMEATIGWCDLIKDKIKKSNKLDRIEISTVKDNVVRLAIH